jgi:hypothetical protein
MGRALEKLLKREGYIKAYTPESIDEDIAAFRKAHPDRPCNGVHAMDFFITLSPDTMARCIFCGYTVLPKIRESA